jgi:hypothetical protein
MNIMQAGGCTRPEKVLYASIYPYYAELCVLTQIRKKPGQGVALRSGIGGHAILYLNGVRRDRTAGYPTLTLCDPAAASETQGVGISVNSHYKNANWVATDGPDFVWRGALEPDEALTRAGYDRTQERAKTMGLLDGVLFHDHLFRDKPPGMSDTDYMYEISVASDYAVRFGRDAMRIRVPLDAARMGAIVRFLNDLNAPYRNGARVFAWRVLNNNCCHVAHNALACAGIWAAWPTGQFAALAAFNFPVPKNEFVDLVMRTNDLPIADGEAMFEDPIARRALLDTGTLPTAPGALVAAQPAIRGDEIYDTEGLRLIFYDNPFWGPYRPRLARILSTPRYADLAENLRHFDTVYTAAKARRSRLGASHEQAVFYEQYDRCIDREAMRVRRLLARLDGAPQSQTETVS